MSKLGSETPRHPSKLLHLLEVLSLVGNLLKPGLELHEQAVQKRRRIGLSSLVGSFCLMVCQELAAAYNMGTTEGGTSHNQRRLCPQQVNGILMSKKEPLRELHRVLQAAQIMSRTRVAALPVLRLDHARLEPA